jgi:hypothetical protein
MQPYQSPSILDLLTASDLSAQKIHDLLGGIAEIARKSLAKFVVEPDGDPNRLQVIGTGFWAEVNGDPKIISAHHVLTEFNMSSGGGVIAANHRWKIPRSFFIADPDADIAIIEPYRVTGIDGNDLATIPSLSIFQADDFLRWQKTSSLLIVGFPASKNIFDRRKPKSSLEQYFQYFSHEFELDESLSKIECGYHEGVSFAEGKAVKVPLPNPEGLSGSPVQMIVCEESPFSFKLAARVVGVVTAWQPKAKKLVIRQIGTALVAANESPIS